MSNFKLIVFFTLLSIGLAVLFFIYPSTIGPIPYGAFAFTFTTLTCVWVASRLHKNALAVGDEMTTSLLRTLQTYFWIMSGFFLFDGIAHVAIPSLYPVPLVASYAHTWAHIFFFAGNAVIIRIPVSFINRHWMNTASITQIVLGVIAVGWRLIHLDSLVYIAPGLPPIVVVDNVSDILFYIANGLALLLPGIYVIYLGFFRLSHEARVRAVFLGIGMIIFFLVGPVIDFITNQYTQLLIHLLLASSFGFMGASALYSSEKSAKPISAAPSAPQAV